MDKEDISEFLETETVYKCKVCEYRTFDKSGFTEHVQLSHRVLSYQHLLFEHVTCRFQYHEDHHLN